MLSVNTNVSSLVAQASLRHTQQNLRATFARLSSGVRINSAADDAAGLGISESLRGQIRSYAAAERNAHNAISMVSTAEGALAETGNMIVRMRELAVQAANGDLVTADRINLNTEFAVLKEEVDRIADATNYNGQNLLGSVSKAIFQVGIGTSTTVDKIAVVFMPAKTTTLGIDTSSVVTADKARFSIGQLDSALGKVNKQRAAYGAFSNRLQVAVSQTQAMRTNLEAANSRIRDVDVAVETSAMAKSQVLMQAGTAVLAQANAAPQLALSLLR